MSNIQRDPRVVSVDELSKVSKHRYTTTADALAAVKKDGYALQYVHNQTEEICLAAVKQNGCALPYVKKQTVEICLAATTQDSYTSQYALQYVNPDVLMPAKTKHSLFNSLVRLIKLIRFMFVLSTSEKHSISNQSK